MNEKLLSELNDNLKRLLNPSKVVSKTDQEKIENYGNQVVASFAKKNLKRLSK